MILFFIILATALVRFWYMPLTFFVQDEWYVFGTFFSDGMNAIWSGLDLPRLGHFVPLSKIISFAIFSSFGLNSLPFNILAIFIHSLNAFLVFLVSYKLIPNEAPAVNTAGIFSPRFVGAKSLRSEKHFAFIPSVKLRVFAKGDKFWRVIPTLVFFTSFIGYEQVNWPMVGLNALSLSISLFAWYLSFDIKKEDLLKICVIPILLISAVLIVESALPMFIFIPGFIIISNIKKIGQAIKIVAPTLIVLVAYVVFRSMNVQSVKGLEGDGIFYRVATRPVEYVAQSFIPQPFLLGVSNLFTNDDSVAEARVFPIVAFLSGLLLLILILSLSRKNVRFLTVLSFLLIFSTPFLFVPETARGFSIFPSRYLYQGAVGSSLIFGLFGFYLLQRKSKFLEIYIFLVALVIGLGLYLNFSTNRRFYEEGKIRWEILNEIKTQYPDLPARVIFFIASDRPYYGLPDEERVLPFQSGLGQTLLVFFNESENFPKEFFKNRFLWEIGSQGYQEIDGRGFGYFRDPRLLNDSLSKYDLDYDSVISYSWDGEIQKLTNTTNETREMLSK